MINRTCYVDIDGDLCDYNTATVLRTATEQEIATSKESGDTGAFSAELTISDAFPEGSRVEGGSYDTEDYDTGKVLEIDAAKDLIRVGWRSGVTTWTSPEGLHLLP